MTLAADDADSTDAGAAREAQIAAWTALTYAALRKAAKAAGVGANGKKVDMLQRLIDTL
jgi:hypothetical protein